MATDLQNDFHDFQRFICDKMHVGESAISLEQALEEFRAYQRDLESSRTTLVNRSKRARVVNPLLWTLMMLSSVAGSG